MKFRVLALIFVVAGCSTPAPWGNPEASSGELQGIWRLSSIECKGGRLTGVGKKADIAVKNGFSVAILEVDGGDVRWRIRRKLSNNEAECRIKIQEKLISTAKGAYKVSDTKGNRAGEASNCKGDITLKGEREHQYSFRRGRLILNLTSGSNTILDETLEQSDVCHSGTVSVVFDRLY